MDTKRGRIFVVTYEREYKKTKDDLIEKIRRNVVCLIIIGSISPLIKTLWDLRSTPTENVEKSLKNKKHTSTGSV